MRSGFGRGVQLEKTCDGLPDQLSSGIGEGYEFIPWQWSGCHAIKAGRVAAFDRLSMPSEEGCGPIRHFRQLSAIDRHYDKPVVAELIDDIAEAHSIQWCSRKDVVDFELKIFGMPRRIGWVDLEYATIDDVEHQVRIVFEIVRVEDPRRPLTVSSPDTNLLDREVGPILLCSFLHQVVEWIKDAIGRAEDPSKEGHVKVLGHRCAVVAIGLVAIARQHHPIEEGNKGKTATEEPRTLDACDVVQPSAQMTQAVIEVLESRVDLSDEVVVLQLGDCVLSFLVEHDKAGFDEEVGIKIIPVAMVQECDCLEKRWLHSVQL